MNGQEAVDKVFKNINSNDQIYCNYDLILMDCNMPIMDGYQATSKIRTIIHNSGLLQPLIIAVTGHIEDSYLIRAIESGMNELSPKPVDNELFEDVLKKLKFI